VATGAVELVIADTWGPSLTSLNTHEFSEIIALSSSVPLILLTGQIWAEHGAELKLGTTIVVRKPMDLEPFLDQIAAAVDRGLNDPELITARELARRVAAGACSAMPRCGSILQRPEPRLLAAQS
jgi:hypothetical protein